MRRLILFLTIFLLLASFSDRNQSNSGTQYIPVLVTRTELESSIHCVDPQPLTKIGKIYTKDGFIFISQPYKGIHVIDNSNPATPVNVQFITVPGCMDMAIKGNSMYVDNATDLVTIDLSSIPDVKVTSRIPKVFPELLPPDINFIPSVYSEGNRPGNTVIIEWRKVTNTTN
jgi:hypothetical protein